MYISSYICSVIVCDHEITHTSYAEASLYNIYIERDR